MTPDLDAIAAQVELPDESARSAARERLGPGHGRLGDLATWLAGTQAPVDVRPAGRVRLIVVRGDRGPGPAGEPRDLAEESGPVAATAADLGVGIRVVDVSSADRHGSSLRPPGGGVGDQPVCSVADADAGLAVGVAVADEEIDAGTDILVVTHVGRGADVAAAALVVLLADVELTASVGRLHGDRSWMRDVAAVRDATRRARPLIADRTALLAHVGGADLAAVTGLLLRAASRRTPVVLDGAAVAACGLVAHRIAYRSAHWWLAADSGAEPAQAAAQERLSLTPMYDLALEASGGLAGLLTVPVLRAAAGLLARP